MKRFLRSVAVVGSVSLSAGLLSVVGLGVAAVPAAAAGCPVWATDNPTECTVSVAVSPAAGPWVLNKTLHVTGSGSINVNVAGITLNIDGSLEAVGGQKGALLIDTPSVAGGGTIQADDTGGNNNVSPGVVTVTTKGDVVLQAGASIHANNTFGNLNLSGDRGGVMIDVNTPGVPPANPGSGVGTRMVLCGPGGTQDARCGGAKATAGAELSASNTGGSTAAAGFVTVNVVAAPVGQFIVGGSATVNATLFAGAVVRTNSDAGPAGQITVTAGEKIVVESGGLVESVAGLGDSSVGGPISLISGCLTLVQGTVRSVGPDPGADLVHLEGCEVHVDGGKVYSQAPGHTGGSGKCPENGHNPVSTVCVEIWARHVIIDNGGQVWADFNMAGGTNGTGWVDIFAQQDIKIAGHRRVQRMRTARTVRRRVTRCTPTGSWAQATVLTLVATFGSWRSSRSSRCRVGR